MVPGHVPLVAGFGFRSLEDRTMIRIAISLVLFIVNMNLYLLALKTKHIFFISQELSLIHLRVWFSCSNLFLLIMVILAINSGLKELHKKELVLISCITLSVVQLIMALNNLLVLTCPYFYMWTFDLITLLAVFLIFNHLNQHSNERRNCTRS